jgi:hypothetical protein
VILVVLHIISTRAIVGEIFADVLILYNSVVLKLWGATPKGEARGLKGAQHTFLQRKIKTARNQLEK